MKRSLSLCLFAALIATRALAATCGSMLFVEAAEYPTNAQTTATTLALIDGDSILDIVTVNSDSISVLIGLGDGSFGPPIVTFLSSSQPSIATGDFDGDGNTDLVVGYYGDVRVLLGHGDGTFDAPVDYQAGNGPILGIVTGTFDANASLDLAVIDGYSNTGNVTVLLGTGTGTFGSPTTYFIGAAGALTKGDFNGDGKLDLATSNSSVGTISVLLGVGDGTFNAPIDSLAGANLGGIDAADLDGDGNLDLVTTTDGYISVLLGYGDGTFQAALQYSSGVPMGTVVLADFDLDGFVDAAVGAIAGSFYGGQGSIAVLPGRGDGSFGPSAIYLSGKSSRGLSVGDLNGDGLPDLVTADLDNQAVSVLLDQADGTLFAAPLSPFNPGPISTNFAEADFDGDGHLDFAWPAGNFVVIVHGDGHGRFEPLLSIPDPNFQSVNGVAAGDFAGSGRPDLIVSDFFNLLRFPNLGAGVFGPAETILSGSQFGIPLVADINHDGNPDVVVSSSCCPSALQVLLGIGDGAFQPAIETDGVSILQILLAADLTGDSNIDLVIDTNPGMELLPGNGDGTFGAAIELTTDSGYSMAASGDFNGDGKPDLLLSGTDPNVALLLGNGGGSFQSPILIALARGSSGLVVGDFDGDGKLDFAVVAGPLLLFRGIGTGHFQAPLQFLSQSPSFLVAGDFDGNGALDIVLGGSSSLETLLNARLGVTVPTTLSVIVGSPAILAASGSGVGPLTYQWRRNGVPLSDGGSISGSHTATLTIDPAAFADAGSYDVVVTDSCTNATSNAAILSVEFDDVPLSNPFHADIITIATAGITGGCTTTSYCPSNNVSRAEMAVFLLKSKYGAGHVPPPPPVDPIFADVPSDAFAAAWIDELSTLGVTAGCGNGNYCPDDPVTRGQMAVFLLKTLLGSGYVPPPAIGIFADVPVGYFAIDWIEDLYNGGITAGCGTSPLRYCPDANVPREQMATFLVRTFLSP